MTEPTHVGSVVDYDNALQHLMEAVMVLMKATVAGKYAPNVNFADAQGRALKYLPEMVALGDAMGKAVEFRALAEAPGALPLNMLEMWREGFEMRKQVLQAEADLAEQARLNPGLND